MYKVHAPALIDLFRYSQWHGFGALNAAARFDSKVEFNTVYAIHALMVVG